MRTTAAVAIAVAAPPAGLQDWRTRSAQPGVVRAIAFDDPSDLGTINLTRVNYPGPVKGCIQDIPGFSPVVDMTKSATDDGGGSLKFTTPAGTGNRGSLSGDWWINFSDDASVLFDEGDTFWVQYRQWFSRDAVLAGAFKHSHILAGDSPAIGNPSSCDLTEIVLQNMVFGGYAPVREVVSILYHRCPSDGGTVNDMRGINYPPGLPNQQLQPARAGYCLWYTLDTRYPSRLTQGGTCFGLFPEEWMTFKFGITLGEWGLADPNFNQYGWLNSNVKLWMAREGQPSELTNDWTVHLRGGYGPSGARRKYGKLWLDTWGGNGMPNDYSSWYDEVLISTQLPADPL